MPAKVFPPVRKSSIRLMKKQENWEKDVHTAVGVIMLSPPLDEIKMSKELRESITWLEKEIAKIIQSLLNQKEQELVEKIKSGEINHATINEIKNGARNNLNL